MPGPRVYIHELVDIIGHQRAKYMYHMTANWGPVGRAERGQLCFGVWGVVGSTGRWPQVVNLWEYADWDALAHNFEVEQQGAGLQDPSLEAWWAEAAEFRSGGFDRILVAPEWSPSVADHEARLAATGLPPVGYAHEIVSCRPGAAPDLLAAVRDRGVAAHAADGLQLVGAFARAMADDDECVLIWSFDDWATWGRFEATTDGPAATFDRGLRDIVTRRRRMLLADAPLSPLRTGRQPSPDDREAARPEEY